MCNNPDPLDPSKFGISTIIPILPNTSLRAIRLKLSKSLKAPRGAQADLHMRMSDGGFTVLGSADGSDENKEIDWWLEEGSEVVLCLK